MNENSFKMKTHMFISEQLITIWVNTTPSIVSGLQK